MSCIYTDCEKNIKFPYDACNKHVATCKNCDYMNNVYAFDDHGPYKGLCCFCMWDEEKKYVNTDGYYCHPDHGTTIFAEKSKVIETPASGISLPHQYRKFYITTPTTTRIIVGFDPELINYLPGSKWDTENNPYYYFQVEEQMKYDIEHDKNI